MTLHELNKEILEAARRLETFKGGWRWYCTCCEITGTAHIDSSHIFDSPEIFIQVLRTLQEFPAVFERKDDPDVIQT